MRRSLLRNAKVRGRRAASCRSKQASRFRDRPWPRAIAERELVRKREDSTEGRQGISFSCLTCHPGPQTAKARYSTKYCFHKAVSSCQNEPNRRQQFAALPPDVRSLWLVPVGDQCL